MTPENISPATVIELAREAAVLTGAGRLRGREAGDFGPVIEAHRTITAAQPDPRLFLVGGAGGLSTEDDIRLVDAGPFPRGIPKYPAASPGRWIPTSPPLTILTGPNSPRCRRST